MEGAPVKKIKRYQILSERILTVVNAEPGLSPSGIAKRLNAPRHIVRDCLKEFDRFGTVDCWRVPEPEHGTLSRRYFPLGYVNAKS